MLYGDSFWSLGKTSATTLTTGPVLDLVCTIFHCNILVTPPGLEPAAIFRSRMSKIRVKCSVCHKETSNPTYCSRSCAAKASNKIPKRKKQLKPCSQCQVPMEGRNMFCGNCRELNKIENRTLAELSARRNGEHPSFKWCHVREHCRKSNSCLPKICQSCGYNKHVELAHIKPLSSLPPETTVKEANSPDNVLVLCPNCHWEFDHGLLDSSRIRART